MRREVRRLTAQSQGTVRGEVEISAGDLEFAHPGRSSSNDADRFLVAQRRAGGERVLEWSFGESLGA